MPVQITEAGLQAAIDSKATGFSGLKLVSVDLYDQNGKVKNLTLKGVELIAPDTIYVVATDSSTDAYDVYKQTYITDTGVEFCVCANEDGSIIQAKSEQSSLMLAYTIVLSESPGSIAPCGDLSLYAPPATEDKLGAVEIATQEEVNAGTDTGRAVVPAKLSAWWESVRTWANIKEKPTAYPAIVATQDEANAGTDESKSVTPKTLKATLQNSILQNGFHPGFITLFAGTAEQIPGGWKLCDGQGTTSNGIPVPDLRDRFVVGAGPVYPAGSTGGAASATSGEGGAHTHTVTVNNTTLTTDQLPSHKHSASASPARGYNKYPVDLGGGQGFDGGTKTNGNTNEFGKSQPHNHTASSGSAGAHTHTVATLPPYFALAYIIKL